MEFALSSYLQQVMGPVYVVNSVQLIEIENVIFRVYQWIVDTALHCRDGRLATQWSSERFTSRMAESTTDKKWTVDKLDDSNCMTWKFQMRHLLLAKGLWGYVDGTEKLAEDATAAVRTKFLKKSQKAFSTIIMAISTSKLYLVTSYDQPKDAWDKLCEHFECKTLANKLFLKKQYFRTEMREGTSMEVHLKHMKEISDKLAAIGAPIAEED